MKKLNKKGAGPDEYLSIEDFFIKDSLIYILSAAKNKIMAYNIETLSLLKSYPVGSFAQNMNFVNNNVFIYNNFSSNSDCKNIYVLNLITGKIINKYADFLMKQMGVSYASSGFAKGNDTLLISFPYDYSIYIVDEHGYNKYLTVDFGEKYMYSKEWLSLSDKEREEKAYSLFTDFWNLPINKTDNLYFSDNYLAFTFIHKISQHIYILNRKTGKSFAAYISSSKNYPFSTGGFRGIINDKLIVIKQSDLILQEIENQKINLQNINAESIAKIKPDDNPVICIYSIKF